MGEEQAKNKQGFQPGNKLGKKWKPGQSGNPNGRRGAFKDILGKLLDEKVGDLTKREAIAAKLFSMAMNGSTKALQILLERSEGKVKEVIEQQVAMKLYHKDAPTEEV